MKRTPQPGHDPRPDLNLILAAEFNFVKDDEEMYDAILFTLGTTNGFFIANSTPWSRDHIFYKIMNDKEYEDYRRHHVTWKQALEPKARSRRISSRRSRNNSPPTLALAPRNGSGMSEDESSWLTQNLIGQCQDSMLETRGIPGDKLHGFWVVK